MIKADKGCCEECSDFAPTGCFLPCNEPATHMVHWPTREEGPYHMCKKHAWHSEKNRGAVITALVRA